MWVAERLSNLNLNLWQTAMAESDDWTALLDTIRSAATSARIRGIYGQALAKFVEAIAHNEGATLLKAEQWERAVVPLLAPEVAGIYQEGVVRAAVNATGGVPEAFFALVGDTLRQPQLFFRPEIQDGLLPIWSPSETPQDSHGSSVRSKAKKSAPTLQPTPSMRWLRSCAPLTATTDEDGDQQLLRIATLIGLDLETQHDE